MIKCPDCGSHALESPHNKSTGYEAYKCVNTKCKRLFDLSELKPKIKMTQEEIDTHIRDTSKKTSVPIFNSSKVRHTSNSGKNNYTTNIKNQNQINKLTQIFGSKLTDIAFNKVTGSMRRIGMCKQYNNQISSGEKIIVDLMIHLYCPNMMEWPLSNIKKLDYNNQQKVLKIISDIDKYLF